MQTKPSRMIAAVTLALMTALAAASPVAAHDIEKGPNGGPMITVGDAHLELVGKGAEIVVFVSDKKHEPIATTGASGRAIVQAGGTTTTVALTPGEGNRLVGTAQAPLPAGARVVVSATVPGKPAMQARFALK